MCIRDSDNPIVNISVIAVIITIFLDIFIYFFTIYFFRGKLSFLVS